MFFSIFHVFCAGIVVLLLIPNLIYALWHRGGGISSGSRAVNLLEQIGRFGCMICMVVPLGVPGGAFGFCSPEAFLIWAAGIAALLLAYYACWVFYALRPGRRLELALAVLPCGVFLLHGVLLRHWLLAVFAGIFAGAHVYIVGRYGGKGAEAHDGP